MGVVYSAICEFGLFAIYVICGEFPNELLGDYFAIKIEKAQSGISTNPDNVLE